MNNVQLINFLCRRCAAKVGREVKPGHLPTWHEGTCDVCGETQAVTEPRDYGITATDETVLLMFGRPENE